MMGFTFAAVCESKARMNDVGVISHGHKMTIQIMESKQVSTKHATFEANAVVMRARLHQDVAT